MTSYPTARPNTPWPLVPLKRVLTLRNGEPYAHIENINGSFPVYGSGGEFARADDFLFSGTSVLFGRKGTVDKPLLVEGKFWCIDTMFYTKLSSQVDARFVHYFALTIPYGLLATDTARPSMTQTDLGTVLMPLPSLNRQRAIADFLDRETAQIDSMIEAQECLLRKLEERRSAIAESAVFTATMSAGNSDSHTWAGDLPSHWRVAALGSVCELIQTGPFGSQLNADEYVDEGIAVVNPADIRESQIAVAEAKKVSPVTAQRLHRHALKIGDVVTARRGALGRSAVVAEEDAGSLCGTGSLLLRPSQGALLPEYLVALLAARRTSEALVDVSVGTTMDNLNSKIMSRFRIPLPSVPEQRDIVKRLASKLVRTDSIVREATQTIVLMRERHEALITAAVTGKIDPEIGVDRLYTASRKEVS